MALANMAAGMAAGDSPYFFTNVGRGAQKGVESLAASNAQEQADRKLLLQNQIEGERFKEQRRVAGLGNLIQAQASVDNRKLQNEQIKATLAAAGMNKEAALRTQAEIARQNWIEKRANHLMQDSIKKFKYNGDTNLALLDAQHEFDLIAPQSMLNTLGLERSKPRPNDEFKPPAAESEKTPWWMPAKPGKIDYELKNGKLVPVDK